MKQKLDPAKVEFPEPRYCRYSFASASGGGGQYGLGNSNQHMGNFGENINTLPKQVNGAKVDLCAGLQDHRI